MPGKPRYKTYFINHTLLTIIQWTKSKFTVCDLQNNDMQQWIQVTLPVVKKITGIITQGAKSFGTEMFVEEFTLEYSDDGRRWTKYTDDKDYAQTVSIPLF